MISAAGGCAVGHAANKGRRRYLNFFWGQMELEWSMEFQYDSIATVGEIRVWWRADFQSGSRVLKKVF